MITATVDKAHLTPSSLRLGLVLHESSAGWTRFAVAELPLALIDWPGIWAAVQRLEPPQEEDLDEPLW